MFAIPDSSSTDSISKSVLTFDLFIHIIPSRPSTSNPRSFHLPGSRSLLLIMRRSSSSDGVYWISILIERSINSRISFSHLPFCKNPTTRWKMLVFTESSTETRVVLIIFFIILGSEIMSSLFSFDFTCFISNLGLEFVGILSPLSVYPMMMLLFVPSSPDSFFSITYLVFVDKN